MERKDRESEQVRVKCAEKRTAMGYKITRHLTLAEGKEFLATGLYSASGLAPSTFKQAKELTALPPGATCMCCGHDLTGQPGWVVEIAAPLGATYKTICAADYETVMSGKSDAPAQESVQEPAQPVQEPAAETSSEPAQAVASASSTPAPENSVEAALQTLASALAAKSAPPPAPSIDKAEIVAEAVKAAKEEAKGFMQKSIADFIRDGGATAATGDGVEAADEAAPVASATGDGVEVAANASSWSAKATPKAVDAVEKLNKFLSEFSYFRAGVSMRLVNTFARAADKAEALRAYCEVSQMEDLPDLIEKMKSPEFGEVCDAFAALDKTPQPLNKRFAVFYGAPGGGKTYAAREACASINGGDCETMVCHSGMDPSDMLYSYFLEFSTNRRGYRPTALLKAMMCGRAVVLDEVNLLPMESRMFLQDILDNKGDVHVMGVRIPIKDGFFVIGTMNIETGNGVQPLPLPLVDRASVVREFRTTTAQAAVGAGLC